MATKGTDIKFNFVGDSSRFTRSARQVEKGLAGLGNKLKASFSPANMLGPLAAAASFQAITAALVDATKVYFEDQRSMALLNTVIDNNTKATTEQKDAIDASIQSMSLMSATSDDDLRQAMSNLVAGTKDTTKSQELLQIALDTSKATGKDLVTVSNAMSKAYNGNYSALKKLLPGVSASKDAFAEMQAAYGGAAEAAGANDPFGQLAIVMENLQEILGKQIAPYLQDFVSWIGGPEGQQAIADFEKGINDIMGFVKPFFDFINSDFMQWARRIQGGWVYELIGAFIPDQKALEESMVATTTLQGILDASGKTVKDLLNGPTDTKTVPIAQRIKDAAKQIKQAGEEWKKSLSFGDYLSDDKKFFNAENFMQKMRDVVAAAKKLPAKLKELRKAGASPEVLQQVIAMGPQEGLAVAEGFIRTGGVKEYSKSLATLGSLGQQSQANYGGSAAYTINVNKANMTADEIIAAIQKYERKTGRQVKF